MAASKGPGKRPPRFSHLRAAYRSGLEATVCAALLAAGVAHQYETYKVPFTQPEKKRTYTPDVTLPNGIVVELKGLFAAEDRQKHLWVKAEWPQLEVRFVFSNPLAKIAKGSTTTYADWCQKHGYQYAKKLIPPEWTREEPHEESLAALARLGYRA